MGERLVIEEAGANQEEDFTLHYQSGIEAGRLVVEGQRSLEMVRTLEVLARFLPPLPARILDVGGGPGVYAGELAQRGYTVKLVDIVDLHVEQAKARAKEQPEFPFDADKGDARDLDEEEASWDAVLLLGPLYHLTEREQRLQALQEARRVLRRGGVLVAAGISRFASLLGGVREGLVEDERFGAIIRRDLREGQHRNPDQEEHPDWFTTAFFHHPDELLGEVKAAGLKVRALLGVEGPGGLWPEKWEDTKQQEAILWAARAVEEEGALLGMSAHLLVVADKT
jgi:SAM-dependent methyltransferase